MEGTSAGEVDPQAHPLEIVDPIVLERFGWWKVKARLDAGEPSGESGTCNAPTPEQLSDVAGGLSPVAILSRPDLAPSDGTHCGEYRIVFEAKRPSPARTFVMLEAILPNPDPACGVEACRPVHLFWERLATFDSGVQGARATADLLEGFYFRGLPDVGPVIQPGAARIGVSGTFGETPWSLREWQATRTCDPPILACGGGTPAAAARACGSNADCAATEYCDDAQCGGAGRCVARPLSCPDVNDPACGCDESTYRNACFAALAGTRVATAGPCACTSNAECAATDYCERPGGGCNDPGECQPRPGSCVLIYDPICGCDGKTYANECEANAAGVSVQYLGECVPVVACETNAECDPVTYCWAETCGGRGTCRPVPRSCGTQFAPVCGCDRSTYPSRCVAAKAEQNVATDGPCSTEPLRPGMGAACTTNTECRAADFCWAERCDEPGWCLPRPRECPAATDPVCGCDGVTYGNACLAAQNGVNLVAATECEALPSGCSSNVECEPEQYCKADGCVLAGACAPRPEGCILMYDPVCACDGKTYGNACESAMAGNNVKYRGECRAAVCSAGAVARAITQGMAGVVTECGDLVWVTGAGPSEPTLDLSAEAEGALQGGAAACEGGTKVDVVVRVGDAELWGIDCDKPALEPTLTAKARLFKKARKVRKSAIEYPMMYEGNKGPAEK